MSQATIPERRHATRHPSQYRAEVVVLSGPHAGEELQGQVIDISKEGLGMRMPAGLSKGDQLGFVIFAEGYESLCVGNVVWNSPEQNDGRYGLRISRWSYLDPALSHQL